MLDERSRQPVEMGQDEQCGLIKVDVDVLVAVLGVGR